MEDEALRSNPEARPGSPPPRIARLAVNGTTLYCEVRGSGPAVLLIHAGGEDAEVWRPVAECLDRHTVVTYDRRGTLRSGREAWPGPGSAQHADDAAALLEALALTDVTVFGASSAGIPAMQLALRHPRLVRTAVIYEPGYLRRVPDGTELQRRVGAIVAAHLAAQPGDWAGAYAAFTRAASPTGALATPPGREWYAQRELLDAEAMVRDDLPILTGELVDGAELAAAPVDIRFACGSESPDLFRDIVAGLAAERNQIPDVIEGVGHLAYYSPDSVASYIAARVQA
jgi:pimeloyl-ACP methyl ester carboxylesterase